MTKQSAIPRMPSPTRLDLTDARRWSRKACRPVPVEIRPFAEGVLHERGEVDAAQVAGAVWLHGDLAADVNSLYLHPVALGGGFPQHRVPEPDTGLRPGPPGLTEGL